jgi:hypothetical protein
MTVKGPVPPSAESQDSIIHLHQPGGRPDERPPSDFPKPVQGLSRRMALAGLALLPAALPVAASATADPVFAMIEQHKAQSAAYDVACNHPGVGAVGSDRSYEAEELADHTLAALVDGVERLFTFQPLTLPGYAAMLRYLSGLEDWQMVGRFNYDFADLREFCASLAAAIEAIIRRGVAA